MNSRPLVTCKWKKYIEGHAKLQLFIPTYKTRHPEMWKKTYRGV